MKICLSKYWSPDKLQLFWQKRIIFQVWSSFYQVTRVRNIKIWGLDWIWKSLRHSNLLVLHFSFHLQSFKPFQIKKFFFSFQIVQSNLFYLFERTEKSHNRIKIQTNNWQHLLELTCNTFHIKPWEAKSLFQMIW